MTEQVTIGKSAVTTVPLGLGTNAVGGTNLFPDLEDDTGKAIVRTGLEAGITLLDTAFAYGLGHSEELIGQVLKDYDRHQVVVASKAAQDLSSGEVELNNSPKFLRQAVDDSLRRLQTDYLDIFYIHFPDQQTPKDEAVSALNDLKQAGKIRAVGVSNFSLAQVKEANRDGYVDVVEDQYSLLHREAEADLLPYLQQQKISFVPYFPLASGLLTGKYHADVTFPANDIRHKNPDFQGDRFAMIVKKVAQLQSVADAHAATIAQVVLAWYVQNPQIGVVIPGAKKAAQVTVNAKALDIKLTAAEYQQIDQLFK
ncbi:aldo/keto reductase [Loigolactobacillus coryniformis]|uniref:aldo/keto reductase n=1 Tax=Loigolactobacillus coryniformis TaxID=1610 RepID=UPI00233FEBB9|nr:aldo/keto reductase [Loigolactobacillus coryniformis]MDC4184687.1 aldo/keto reductase [Loigolactobacillus coryniformis]